MDHRFHGRGDGRAHAAGSNGIERAVGYRQERRDVPQTEDEGRLYPQLRKPMLMDQFPRVRSSIG